jgi:hypothetical protein
VDDELLPVAVVTTDDGVEVVGVIERADGSLVRRMVSRSISCRSWSSSVSSRSRREAVKRGMIAGRRRARAGRFVLVELGPVVSRR